MTSLSRSYALAAIMSVVWASGFAASPPEGSCDSARSTMEINRCAWDEFQAQDDLLNQAYQVLLRELNTDHRRPTRESLIRAQRLWVQFRDADCAAQESVYDGGTVHKAVYLECLRDHTAQRIKDLTLSKWKGG